MTPTTNAPFAHIYGCSHSMYFHTSDVALTRLRDLTTVPQIGGEVIIGASVMGFRPRASKLKTKEIVTDGAKQAQRLVLAFGQVDLELGYYYRRVIKKEDISPEGFIETLVGHYTDFVAGLPIEKSRIALKGVNLTVLENPDFTFRYTRRIITEEKSDLAPKTPRERRQMRFALRDALLPVQVQNAMHLAFNALIAHWADRNGARYFDINDAIARPDHTGKRDPELGLDPVFAPSGFDHHLTDSLAVRAAHVQALTACFADTVAAPEVEHAAE